MAANNSKPQQVCVVGAGVVGLSTAVHLLERFPGKLDLTLVADKFSPHTVSDKATGIFIYSDLGVHSDQVEDGKRWLSTSLQRIQSIFSSAENAQIGISLTPGYVFLSSPQPEPWWKNLMFGFRQVRLNSAEANALSVPPDCAEIWAFSTYTLTPTVYLGWLMDKATKLGCTIKKAMITDLNELTFTYDVVINCTGLGSCKELVSDSKMYPIRGQYVLVRAPWIKHWLLYEDFGDLIIAPRASDVVLGATVEVGNWTESTDEEVISRIKKTCCDWVPSLAGAEVIGAFAGLRPGRDSIRLEECLSPNGSSLVHCYGHGGKGVVLSWGCAVDIGNIVDMKF